MPNIKHVRRGWHIGDSNYCGPFTDLNKDREVRNKIDQCCKTHDEEYSSEISTRKADDNLIDCLPDYHPIRGVFRLKKTIDELTDYKSNEIFRPDMPKDGGKGNKKAQQAWRVNQYYQNKKQKTSHAVNDGAGTSHDDNSAGALLEAMRDEHDPEGGEDNMDIAATAGGGGGGQTGGGDGENIKPDRPMGAPAHRGVRTYQRSFTSYVTNGVGDQSWLQYNGDGQNPPYVEWNDGWSFIPWGLYPSAITPDQWVNLQTTSARFRVLECSVCVDSVIPFQEVLTGGGTVREAVTSFSNRPSILVYKDNGNFLPQLYATPIADLMHNANFTMVRGNFTQSVLKRPTWRFNNWETAHQHLKVSGTPAQASPCQILSLEANGRVKTLYPGGNFCETWKNPVKQWMANPLPWDRANRFATSDAASVDALMQDKGRIWGCHYLGGVGTRGILNSNQTIQAENYVANYGDTGQEIKHCGPPYILMKMEPYYGTNNEAMSIFAQIHVHYSITIEFEEREGTGAYCSMTDYSALVRNTELFSAFGNAVLDSTCQAPADNKLGRMAGTTVGHYSYS